MSTAIHDPVELRGMVDRETVDVLDAVSTARRISRIELVNEVLCEWAVQQMHIATVVCRVTKRNGSDPEGERK